MLSAYPACFFKEDTGYSVIFPDLNDLATCGETLDEAISMATDCLAGYLYWLDKDGEAAPSPSPIHQISLADTATELDIFLDENAFVNIVAVDVDQYAKLHFEKSVKKTLTIPAWLNIAAQRQGINFSQVLQEALKAQLYPKKQ